MLWTTLLCLHLTAAAPAEPQGAPERLQAAQARLDALDDDGAAALFRPISEDPTVPSSVRARAALGLALAQSHLGQPERAQAAFKLALGQDPAVTLPADAGADVTALFTAAREELAQKVAPQAALPPRDPVVQEPSLGWTRPTSYIVMGVGGVFMVAGAAVAFGGFLLRAYITRYATADQVTQLAPLLFPVVLGALALIVLSIPTGGTGLALFFLSGNDGPMKDTRPGADDPPTQK